MASSKHNTDPEDPPRKLWASFQLYVHGCARARRTDRAVPGNAVAARETNRLARTNPVWMNRHATAAAQ